MDRTVSVRSSPVEPARQTRPTGEVANNGAEFRVSPALQFSPGSPFRALATAGSKQSLYRGEAGYCALLAQLSVAKLARDYCLYLLLIEARGGGAVYEVGIREQGTE